MSGNVTVMTCSQFLKFLLLGQFKLHYIASATKAVSYNRTERLFTGKLKGGIGEVESGTEE